MRKRKKGSSRPEVSTAASSPAPAPADDLLRENERLKAELKRKKEGLRKPQAVTAAPDDSGSEGWEEVGPDGVEVLEDIREPRKKQKLGKTSSKPVTKLFVGGLPSSTTEQQLRELFGKRGAIGSIDMPAKTAYITFKHAEDVERAVEADGTQFQGNTLKVNTKIIGGGPEKTTKKDFRKGKGKGKTETSEKKDKAKGKGKGDKKKKKKKSERV